MNGTFLNASSEVTLSLDGPVVPDLACLGFIQIHILCLLAYITAGRELLIHK